MIGTQISHYRVLARIGQGGMGEVYLAEDLTLARKAALKFLPGAQAADDSGRHHLVREAQSAAGLDHPYICKIYEVGESDGRPFIAMEYVEGTTLRERLAGGRLPVAQAIRIACELAEALDLAHQRGIIHRDLKPPNIMLPPDGHVKVMDFGLAKRVSDAVAATATAASGVMAGTLAYMSPEQLLGLALDARSDIFAFGLVLHEMVTGVHPFARPSPISTTDAILHDAEPPIEPPAAGAPPALGRIISRALAKNREDRYQSIRDVGFELRGLAEDSASATRRPPPRRPGRARWTAAAATAGALAVGALAVWRLPIARPLSQKALAFKERDWMLVADFENLTGDKVFDRSLRAAVEVGIAQSHFVNVFPAGRVQETLRRMSQATIDRLDEGLASEIAVRDGVKAVLSGSIAQIGDVYAITMRLIDPQSHATVMTDSVQAKGKDQVLPALDTLTTRVRQSLGESLGGISQQRTPLPKATTSSLEALKMYADSFRLTGRDSEVGNEDLLRQALALDPEFALAHAEYGWRFSIASDPASRVAGEQHLVKALSLLDRLSARERLWISALVEDSRGNRRQAVEAYKSYLAQYPDDARAWFRMGWTQMATLGEPAVAIDAFERSLALNPSDAGARVNLATCYNSLGRQAEAIGEYEKAFAVDPALLTGEFVNSEYGFSLVQAGQAARAADVFEKMIAAGKKARGLRSLALLDMYRGKYDAAIASLREAILVNHANRVVVSEFRDRLFLVRAIEAKGTTRALTSELDAVDGVVARTPLGPEWLVMPAKIHARSGQLDAAKKLLAMMSRTASDATVGSSANRDTSRDTAYLDVARGELALAEGRATEAVGRFQAAYVVDPRNVSALESLATALVASGRLDDAVKRYEELIASRTLGLEAQEDWLRAHVRIGELYERLGKADAARASYEHLIALWTDGDSDLVALKEARERLARLSAAAR